MNDPKRPSRPSAGAASSPGRPAAVSRPSAVPGRVDAPGKTKDLLQAAPRIEAPKGGGAIHGIDETFQANPVTGSASLEVPLPFPPGRGGLTPALSLSYDSGAGNGVFGLGWSLSLPAIRRKTDKELPRYRDAIPSDTFVLAGFEDLVPVGTPSVIVETSVTFSVQRYQPRIEGGFALLQRWTNGSTGAVHWRTRSAQNVLRRYGSTAASQTKDPSDASRTFCWYLDQEEDELGNVIRYVYDVASGASPTAGLAETGRVSTFTYLKRVQYGNKAPGTMGDGWSFEVVFDYGEHDDDALEPHLDPAVRTDPFSSHKSGFDIRCFRLCQRVLVFHRLATDLTDGTDAAASLVKSLDFTYAPSAVATTLQSVTLRGYAADGSPTSMPSLDFTYVAASPASGPEFLTGIEDLPVGVDFSRAQWVDLDGEGLQGLLTEDGAGWWFKRNEGSGRLGTWRRLPTRPGPALAATQLADLDGDGRLEVVQRAPPQAGSWARTADGGWDRFRRFDRIPFVPETWATSRSIDVDGDGRADLLVADAQGLLVFRSDGVRGWKAPERVRRAANEAEGPVLLFANATESLFLADMDGDGLVDLVRVRHASVCYWPNVGYGRFGARVQMANAPFLDRVDRFDARRVRLADIDGAGPADLIYVGPDRVRWWSNESGNGFSTSATVPNLPGVADPITVTVADLRGDGTACLVWASPLGRDRYTPIRYIRLMSAGKPYLLATVTTNLGRTTTLQYTPSTSFYLADRRAGRPWATRLPFPVQCLAQVTNADAVTGLVTVTSYAYHHGYFDGVEREFRGFGKVEQWDAESFPQDEGTTHLPPVRTVTWFHTGAWEAEARLLATFASEYYSGDPDAFAPAETSFDITIALAGGGTMLREAHRALKGKPLRQEIYAEDGLGPTSSTPYSVTMSAWAVRTVRMRSGDTPGVFLVTPSETLSYHYERNPDDPRVEQQLTLAVDSFGVITRAATVHYPRRTPSVGTLDAQQARGECRITRTEVIHDTAGTSQWHVGLPYRSRTWKLQPEASEDPSTFYADKVTAADIAPLIALPVVTGSGSATTPVLAWDEAEPTDSAWLKKLSDTVTTYDDDGTELTAGTVGVRALVHQRVQLAFTEDQAADLLGRVGAPADLEAAGYIELTATPFLSLTDVAGTWARSGTQERDAAHFYVTTALTDPFGNETTVAWHSSYLFPESVTDALGNVVTGTWDLRVLSPSEVTDPNGDQTRLAYDALGRVTAMAVVGNASEGDTLSSPTAEFEYDTSSVPAWAWGRVRETHGVAVGSTRWIETTEYSDGAGSVVMTKATAAPDGATARWIGSGLVVLNNKGLPIKQYEPFYSTTDAFEAEEGFSGVTPLITYDPLGRAIRVDMPNGTLRRIEFSPWEQTTWDENDTVTESEWYDERIGQSPAHEEEDLALDAAEHADTPTTVRLDVLGRPFQTIERLDESTELLTTLTLDAVGNPLVVTDPREVEIQTQSFDMLGRPITTESPDGGDVTALLDVAGQPLFLWKSGDLGIETEVDALRRKVRTWQWDTDAETRVLRERTVFGEGLDDSGTYDPKDDHLRGRLYRIYDTAGMVELSYDFKGNVLTTTRRFFDDDEEDINWQSFDPVAYPFVGDDKDSVAELHNGDGGSNPGAASLLESEEFTVSATFDAMNRVVTRTTPDGAVTAHEYDDGGRLNLVEVDSDTIVADIQHNARGQRTFISYGNGVTTTSAYEPLTFRLHTLVSSGGRQSLEYRYDPVGNILGIDNNADDTLYFDNAAVEPHQSFQYDALYRLTNAWGREKSARGRADWVEPAFGPVPDTSETMQGYEQRYSYDVAGNITEMRHLLGSTTDWVRTYTYPTTSNRLSTTTEAAGIVSYQHDVRGNIVFWPHLYNGSGSPPNVEVDFRDQMRKAQLDSSNYAVYHYDHSGQRARKVVKRGANVEERRYVAGWEVWRKVVSGTLDEERTTLHVMDDERRVAMSETKTVAGGSAVGTTVPRVRYQLDNHLGTSVLELDESGGIISYEEYHPYGTCAWWAGDSATVSQRRYRYTGMERDDETGLQVHGVRYYAPWLGRWGSADPIGLGDGANRFAYCGNHPIDRTDPAGLQGTPEYEDLGDACLPLNEDQEHGTEEYLYSDTDSELTLPEPPGYNPELVGERLVLSSPTDKDLANFLGDLSRGLPEDSGDLAAPASLVSLSEQLHFFTRRDALEYGGLVYLTESGETGFVFAGAGGAKTMGELIDFAWQSLPADTMAVAGLHTHPTSGRPSGNDILNLLGGTEHEAHRGRMLDAQIVIKPPRKGEGIANKPGMVLLGFSKGVERTSSLAEQFLVDNGSPLFYRQRSPGAVPYKLYGYDDDVALHSLAQSGAPIGMQVYVFAGSAGFLRNRP